MAKRGYRGKHPHNDMKVSPNPSSNKYDNVKLTEEYKKLKNDRTRYDYIRTHYYYPQSTCTITVDANPAADENIVITSTDGTSVTYVAKAAEDASSKEFKLSDPSGSLATCINNSAGHNGKITAVASVGSVLLTQAEPGPDGNKAISGSTPMSASGQSGIISTNGSFTF